MEKDFNKYLEIQIHFSFIFGLLKTFGSCPPLGLSPRVKENRIYIRVEFRQSLSMNCVIPFQPEREFKVYKSCKCSEMIYSRVH